MLTQQKYAEEVDKLKFVCPNCREKGIDLIPALFIFTKCRSCSQESKFYLPIAYNLLIQIVGVTTIWGLFFLFGKNLPALVLSGGLAIVVMILLLIRFGRLKVRGTKPE